MIARLFKLNNQYRDNLRYDIIPSIEEKGDDQGYNSNSFVSGLLSAAGFEDWSNSTRRFTPGYDKPVPSKQFGSPCLSIKGCN
jgi:hypothetical protein